MSPFITTTSRNLYNCDAVSLSGTSTTPIPPLDAGPCFRSPAPGGSRTMVIGPQGGEPVATAEVRGGSHSSLSPDGRRVLDVSGHKVLWVSPLDGGQPAVSFEFEDPTVRIDYPLWSPDGTQVIFDRFRPEGGDVWLLSPR